MAATINGTTGLVLPTLIITGNSALGDATADTVTINANTVLNGNLTVRQVISSSNTLYGGPIYPRTESSSNFITLANPTVTRDLVTDVPSWASRITITFTVTSGNTGAIGLRAGDSSSYYTTQYISQRESGSGRAATTTSEFTLVNTSTVGLILRGNLLLINAGNNHWTASAGFDSTSGSNQILRGRVKLLNPLTRIQLYCASTVSAITAGTINVYYE